MKMRIMVVIVAVALFAPFAASAQDAKTAELEGRIKALEAANISRGTNVASAVSRAEAIQTEFGTLKGAVDSNTHMIQGLSNQLQTMFQGMERRIQVLEDKIQMIDSMLKRGAGDTPRATEEYLAYQAAVEKMNGGDYLGAAADFQTFVQNFPKSTLVENIQFHVGECYYFARDYAQAIKQFQVFIERNSRSPKVADAMVMQGSAFVELKMVKEANAFFTKVVHDFPETNAAKQAQLKLQLLQSGGAMTAQNSTPGHIGVGYPTETIQQQKAREKTELQQMPQVQQPTTAPTTPANKDPEKKRNYMEF